MRILVTGATGFIGRWIVPCLARDADAIALLSRAGRLPDQAGAAWEAIRADLADPGSYRTRVAAFQPDVCVHLAWGGIPNLSPAACRKNLAASTALIDLLLRHTPCRRLIVSGSCAEYGNRQGPCREDVTAAPRSPLGRAKAALFDQAKGRCRRAGVALTWFRIFFAYGPGQRDGSLIPTLAEALAAGRVPPIRTPGATHDFVFVGDLGPAFKWAAEGRAPGGIYNLGSGRPASVIEICRRVEWELRGNSKLSDQLADTEAGGPAAWADVQKTACVMGWQARTSLEQGIHLSLGLTGGACHSEPAYAAAGGRA